MGWRRRRRADLALVFVALFCALFRDGAGDLVNEKVLRKVNLNTEVPRVSTQVSIKNTGTREATEIVFRVPRAVQTVVRRDSPTGAILNLAQREDLNGYQTLTVDLAIQPGGSANVHLSQVEFKCVENVPASIQLKEAQYLRYSGGFFYLSPYKTIEQSTEIALPSSTVSSVSEGPGPVTVKGKNAVLGPYHNVEGDTQEPFKIRYKYLRGMILAETMHKHISVSHWGNMRVEEEYVLRNSGPVADFENRRDDPGFAMPHVSSVIANLPKVARDIQYRDAVGNITSSHLRNPSKGARHLDLKFRFPLYGGWQTTFWYSYNVPLVPYIKPFGGQYYQLRVNFEPTITPIPAVSNYLVTIVLPEGASEVKVEVPAGLRFDSQSNKTVFPSLSVSGSESLSFSRENFMGGSFESHMLLVEYRYSSFEQLRVPLMISGCLLWIFSVVIIGGRVAESARPKAKSS